MSDVIAYKDGDLISVITKENGEAKFIVSAFPHCLDYVEDAENYNPIDDWSDGMANGTILIRASEDKIRHLNKVVEMLNTIHVHKVGHVSYDEDRDCDSHSSGVKRKNLVEIFFNMIREVEILDLQPDQILDKVNSFVSECFDPEYGGTWEILTEDAYREEQSENVRKNLEQSASWFAKECGHPVGSFEYVLAAQEALARREQDMEDDCYGERRMERAAASRFSGQSSEGYWSDEDYIRSHHEDRISEVAMVLQWLDANCPLLMLKVQEQELLNNSMI